MSFAEGKNWEEAVVEYAFKGSGPDKVYPVPLYFGGGVQQLHTYPDNRQYPNDNDSNEILSRMSFWFLLSIVIPPAPYIP